MKKNNDDMKKRVKEAYSNIAEKEGGCCSSTSCCGMSNSARKISRSMGYSEKDMADVPDDANLGLGCGNPVAIASLKRGDIVLDLGSGAGFDVFLAADRVGDSGHVIGVDMTEKMIEKAKRNASKGNYKNVEFRLGEIEKLPVEDRSVDIVISNCVINLSEDKEKVFQEAYRVLKPGGKIFISDIVVTSPLPEWIRESVEAYVGCIAGASLKDDYLQYIKSAGFEKVKVLSQSEFNVKSMLEDAGEKEDTKKRELKEAQNSVKSVKLQAEKPLTDKGGNNEN